jgi:hypothetical protein
MRGKSLALLTVLAALAVPGQARAADPVFHGSISTISAAQRERMIGSSWHSGCPVPIRDLRLLKLDYWGFAGALRRGSLIVHEDQARRVRRVFAKLFYAKFRIRRMRLIDAFDGSDDRSMDANNTSAFNCRFVAGQRAGRSMPTGARSTSIQSAIPTSRGATSPLPPARPTPTGRGTPSG